MLPNIVNYSRPALVIWSDKTQECKIIDLSVRLDQNVSMKETEKVTTIYRLYLNYNNYIEHTYR